MCSRVVAAVAQRRAAIVVAVAAALAACSAPAAVDGGQDASHEADVMHATCAGASTCDGTTVRACRKGQLAEALQQCAPSLTCSQGRCISSDCAKAEANQASLAGCTFYTFDLQNVTADDSIPTSVLVTNPGQVVANASLERREAGLWTAVMTTPVPPLSSARIVLSAPHLEGGGLETAGAFRLASDEPVMAAHIQSDDSTAQGSSSTGGTLLLPAHVLGRRYRALTYVQVATPMITVTTGAMHGAGQLVIVGTQDATTVTISPTVAAQLGSVPGASPPAKDGSVMLTLEDGDLFQLFSTADGADLSGTQIAADKPIAVFSGNVSTTYGLTATGISSPDMAHEQLLPVSSWSTSYVAAELTPQSGVCDTTIVPAGASIWRIVADHEGTDVHFTAGPDAGVPPPDRTIGPNEVLQVQVIGDFAVTSSMPVLVMQGMDCEPTLSSAVPTTVWLDDYWFAVLPNFDNLIAVVRRTGQTVYLDGQVLGGFSTSGAGFDVARVHLDPCPRAEGVCTHHLQGQFGFTMRGMDVQCSYALTAPTWVPCSEMGLVGCLN
ncbi:MAG TPA: IgGFc-binding protein [Polyangia bacterium]|nr:IgGFc-binding protein [Polyangia bacterium]